MIPFKSKSEKLNLAIEQLFTNSKTEFYLNDDIIQYVQNQTGKKFTMRGLGKCLSKKGFKRAVVNVDGSTKRGFYPKKKSNQLKLI